MRLAILKKAIKLNVPILIDKPLASSWKETKEIEKIFKESENNLYICNTLIFNPIYRNLLERVRNGECGKLVNWEMGEYEIGNLRNWAFVKLRNGEIKKVTNFGN